jgi:hypothetical protein
VLPRFDVDEAVVLELTDSFAELVERFGPLHAVDI